MKNAEINFDRLLVQRYVRHRIFSFFKKKIKFFREFNIIIESLKKSLFSIYRQTFYSLEELQREREMFVKKFQQLVLACE